MNKLVLVKRMTYTLINGLNQAFKGYRDEKGG